MKAPTEENVYGQTPISFLGSSADESLFLVLKQSVFCDGTVKESLVRQILYRLFSKDTYIDLYYVVLFLAPGLHTKYSLRRKL